MRTLLSPKGVELQPKVVEGLAESADILPTVTELYDLESDPGEKSNVAADRPFVARHMHSLLKDRIAYYQAKIAERDREKAKSAGSAQGR